jgi:hypothetical protein
MSENISLKNIKESYKARIDDENKLIRNICNYGLKKGQRASVTRNGEYFGFAIEILDDVRPLLTDHTIKFILDNYDNTDKIIKYFNIEKYFMQYGEELIDYIIVKFFNINELAIPKFIKNENIKINDINLDGWITTTMGDPINYKLKIYGIGSGKLCSVVPEDWIDKEFESGKDLHSAIDKLEWRQGKPNCSYCCIYSMIILEESLYIFSFENLKNISYDVIIINYINDNLKTEIYKKTQTELKKIKIENYHRILLNNNLIIIYNNEIIVTKPIYIKTDSVSYMVSTLQKCIRRGIDNIYLIGEILRKINNSNYYTLPEHNFVKISGSRQMMWRSFISIIEDACGYIKDKNMLDLDDICSLSILCQYDINIQFTEKVIQNLEDSLIEILNHKKKWNWDKFKEFDKELTINNSGIIYFATKYMPMMGGDKKMLNCVVTMLNSGYKFDHLQIQKYNFSNKEIKKMKVEGLNTEYAGYDMHCKPAILIHLQSEIDFINKRELYDTHLLSKFIWNNSSRINYRNNDVLNINDYDKSVLQKLYDIQKLYYHHINNNMEINIINIKDNFKDTYDIIKKYKYEEFYPEKNNKKIIDTNICTRNIFLLLFGQKIKYKKFELLVCGTDDNPIKIKKYNSGTKKMDFITLDEDIDNKYSKLYIEYLDTLPNKCLKIVKPKLLENFSWINSFKKLNHLHLKCKLNNNKYNFFVENIEVSPSDCSNIINTIPEYKTEKIKNDNYLKIIINMLLFNIKPYPNINFITRYISKSRKINNNYNIYDWTTYNLNITHDIWKKIYSKIIINDTSLTIGPVDRNGNKTYNSIDYIYEGVHLRLFNLLSLLYPDCIFPSGELIFKLNKKGIGYSHMIESLYDLSFLTKKFKKENNIMITTKIWEHQDKSINKFYNAIIKLKKLGVGDSSKVGSGKTLVALSLISKLHNINSNMNFGGFLILIPNAKLYDTWETEIKNHTDGFDCVLYDKKLKNDIKRNTIIISTLGRMRDHPIYNNWIFVVIDECLSVQNKEALHTEEALRQIMASQYGVLLCSATFFRSRFDKLYYMLKMLRTGLPLESKYLDTILSDTIICNTFDTGRKWYVTENKLYLDNKTQKKYNNIIENNKNKTDEEKYGLLTKFISDNCNYIDYFNDTIKNISNDKNRKKSKILIFTKSKDEAINLAESNKNIGLYPDINKKHVCGSINSISHGINNLVGFDTIMMRPCNFDILPQCKGRLDRPGQLNTNLYLEYLYLDKTIEIAGMYKIAMGNNFYENYILPLSEFYKIAIDGVI